MTTAIELKLVASTREPEYSPLGEPLQTPDALSMRGVRSNAMTRAETTDTAGVVGELDIKSGDPLVDNLTRAHRILVLTGVLSDIELLDESPTLSSTALGALARGVSAQRLDSLLTAYEIESLSHTADNSARIFRYRLDSGTAIEANPRTNLSRVLHEVARLEKFSKDDIDSMTRMVGYVMHQQLVRSGHIPSSRN